LKKKNSENPTDKLFIPLQPKKEEKIVREQPKEKDKEEIEIVSQKSETSEQQHLTRDDITRDIPPVSTPSPNIEISPKT